MRIVLCFLFLNSALLLQSQTNFEQNGSAIFKVDKIASISQIAENKEHWDVQLKSFTPSENKSMLSREELTRLKAEGNMINKDINVNRGLADAPLMNINFEGNRGTGGVPPDNTLAVSDNGFVVTSINSGIIFTRADGKITYNTGLADFFVDLSLGSYFDPRILFDAEQKRFIVVALSGSKANVSSVAIAFSHSEDPSMGWNFYKLKGDILSEGVWFDYPNIGITDHELFISGNMFSDENAFRYSSIYQVSKINGYDGNALDVKHYTKMKEPTTGQNFFNMTPCPAGWNDNLPSSMGFLTNDNRGGKILLYTEITGNLASNPTFKIINSVTTKQYNTPQDGNMKGNADILETFDCRIMYAFNLNGIIHYVFKTSGNQFAAINYGRFNLETKKVYSTIYAEPNMHISYPSIVPFGADEKDSKVLINYLRSNSSIFPEQASVVCEGSDDNFVFSESVLIKKGENTVNALDGTVERWGDYTAATRRFSNNKPEVWVSGCFGRTRYGSWTAQFINKSDAFNDFYANNTVINPGDSIAFQVLSTDTLSNIGYQLEGANYLTGFDSTFMASYDSIGSYDAILKAINQNGDTISIVKKDFIHVVPEVFVPMSDFEADKTAIFEGDSVKFTDLSTNDPKKLKWTFISGTPNTSDSKSPVIAYAKKGSFAAILNAKNAAGEDVEIKQKYIVVSPKPIAPFADFVSDKNEISIGDSIQLTDLSKNQPTTWEWIINSDIDADTFYNQNPKVVFNSLGAYDVQLIVGNSVGLDTLQKQKYITVGEVSTKNINWFSNVTLYPNPVASERVVLTFELAESLNLSFNLIDANGNLVKKLIEKNVRSGRNELSFDSSMLAAGIYILSIQELNSKKIKSLNLTVVK